MKIWPFLLVIGILLFVILGLLVYIVTAGPSEPKTILDKPVFNSENRTLDFDESYIDYLIYAIGGWKLHNPPLSSDTPKIEVVVDGEIYTSEINDGEIITERKSITNEDIIITLTKQEIVDIIDSEFMEDSVQESVKEGRINIELKANYKILFGKGYLSLYKDLTGESLGGSLANLMWRN